MYRVAQLNFTPEIEVFYILFERSLSIFKETTVKLLIEYFNFRCTIQLDLSASSVPWPDHIIKPGIT